jgi:hypothetical protein
MIVVAFQNIFHSKMHKKIFFIFFKIFLILAYQNNKKKIKKLILYKNKFLNFVYPPFRIERNTKQKLS